MEIDIPIATFFYQTEIQMKLFPAVTRYSKYVFLITLCFLAIIRNFIFVYSKHCVFDMFTASITLVCRSLHLPHSWWIWWWVLAWGDKKNIPFFPHHCHLYSGFWPIKTTHFKYKIFESRIFVHEYSVIQFGNAFEWLVLFNTKLY